jgi:quinol monooxygenase YgiN
MGYGMVVKLTVQPGLEGEFEAAFRQAVASVKANEPTTRFYQCFKSQTEPYTYVTMELFESQEAQAAHQASEHFQAILPRIKATLAAPPDAQKLDLLPPL